MLFDVKVPKGARGCYRDGRLVFVGCPIRYEYSWNSEIGVVYPPEVNLYIDDEDARFWFNNMFEVRAFEEDERLSEIVRDCNYVGAVLGRMGRNKRKSRGNNGKRKRIRSTY